MTNIEQATDGASTEYQIEEYLASNWIEVGQPSCTLGYEKLEIQLPEDRLIQDMQKITI